MFLAFIQPDEYKYNSFVETKHPDWEYLDVRLSVPDDPLGLREYVNQLMVLQMVAYFIAVIIILNRKFRLTKQSLFTTDNELLAILRNTLIHFLIIIAILIITKLYFGMASDVGNNIVASYITFMIYATSYQILNRSDFFDRPGSFFSFPQMKYQKSSLSDDSKELILKKIDNGIVKCSADFL